MHNLSKKIYFASDFHLGAPNANESAVREQKIIRWLSAISSDASDVFLVGDIFDFWFEYKHVIPKGFIRLQGKLAEMVDSGIKVHFFIGNHDMWMFDYFEKELGVTIHRKEQIFEFGSLKIFIGHGDGLGPGDNGYKFIKKIFSNRFFQWCFARFHPNFGIGMANFWSQKSREKGKEPHYFLGPEKEWLVNYCETYLKTNPQQNIDFFIFGHRHLPINYALSSGARYINLGDWINDSNYAVFNGNTVLLEKFED